MRLTRHPSVVVLLAIASTLTVAACGTGGGDIRKDDPGHTGGAGDGTMTAGSRLVPLSYQGNDGSKTFAGLFDKQINKECAFDRFGSIGVCVPRDVYTVDAQVFSDSHKTASPALFVDSECSQRSAIALDETADCMRYGVIRVTGSLYSASDVPGCGQFAYGTGLAAVKPVPAGTKVYAYGVPKGGGQCCSCNEWTPPEGSTLRAYLLEGDPGKVDLGSIGLVTGKLDYPTGP